MAALLTVFAWVVVVAGLVVACGSIWWAVHTICRKWDDLG